MSRSRKSVLITGCREGGIGNALAREFHAKGLRVFATARSASQLPDLEAMGIETFSLDVTSRPQMIAVSADIIGRTGGNLDILVNNAARSYASPALDVTPEEIHATFESNLFSIMYMVQYFAPLLIKAKGTIVNISSGASIVPVAFGSTFNATKAALNAYSDTLRVEMMPFGVKVVVVVTGSVKSKLSSNNKEFLPPDSLYTPVSEEFLARQGYTMADAMPSSTYAKNVVAEVLNPNPPIWIWKGRGASQLWFIQKFLPRSFLTWLFKDKFGLDKLTNMYRKARTD